jgi:hypothetical protein
MKTILRTAALVIWSGAAGLGLGACGHHAPPPSNTCQMSDWGNTRQLPSGAWKICNPDRSAHDFIWQPLPGRQMAS